MPRVTGLALVAYRQHEYSVNLGDMAVQGYIAPRATADHQPALGIRYLATDQWVQRENFDRPNDLGDPLARVFDLMAGQAFEDAIQILCNLGGQFNAGHLQGASLCPTGRAGALPSIRASR